ncbi:hypothetical protein HanPI659440_Chr15g0582561 [Helianthus annuus]|nr:hypothetical protein HanPI659440_Chr15g0582561 [Helianthus annuus]
MVDVIHLFPSINNNNNNHHPPSHLHTLQPLLTISLPLQMENIPTLTASNSPEFEFRNPSSDQTTLHSADQLFSDGVLLPLHLLTTTTTDDPPDIPTNPPSDNINIPGSDPKVPTFTASKRWKDIFKKNPEKKDKEIKKKKEKNVVSGAGAGVGTATAELNINLWPFSRSRSAGNNRPRTVAGNRKVSSAPCSRSNSTGDKYRKWPNSPGRVGVHLGRSSPVWQAKRVGLSRSLHDGVVRSTAEKSPRPGKSSGAGTGAGGNAKVLNINVPACIGYRQRMGCQSDVSKENNGSVAGGNGGATAVGGGGDGGASGLFNLRSLFTKKVF